jgi:hypothetical protein
MEMPEEKPVFIESSTIKSRIAQSAWRNTIDKVPTYGSGVGKIAPDRGEILYWSRSDDTKQIGMVNWLDGQQWSTPAPEDYIGMAYYNGRMFVLFDKECTVLDNKGNIEATYPLTLPSPYEFRSLEILPARENHPAALVLGAQAQAEDGLFYQIQIYKLSR